MQLRRLILAGLLAGAMTATHADSAAWSKSYQLEGQGKYAEALAALGESAAGGEQEMLALRRGWLKYLQGWHEDALRDYRQAISLNGRSLEARLGLMLPLLALQRWPEAASQARLVLEQAPWNYLAATRLLAALEGQRDWPALASLASELAERYPSDATALVYLGRAHAALGRRDQAQKAYLRVLVRMPEHREAKQFLAKGP